MFIKRRKRIPVIRPDAVVAAPPGTLNVPPGAQSSRVSVIAYGPDDIVEETIEDLSRLETLVSSYPVTWIDVVGLGTLDTLVALSERFGLHRLAIEDVVNIPQRPKFDDYEDHQFMSARMPVADEHLATEQLSVFLGKNFIITFQERPGDCFDGVRTRLRQSRPRIRGGGPDYLLYAILDALVDSYFPLLESMGSTLDDLEGEIQVKADRRLIDTLYSLKRDFVTLRRYVAPLRELISALLRDENTFLSDTARTYLRDCSDHSAQALDLINSDREIASGLIELYLSMQGQRMNEIMKVLTIIATIFIPLSFIAGVYGMNFDPEASRWNMPELGWAFGYPFALGVMGLCVGTLMVYFWRRGWFR